MRGKCSRCGEQELRIDSDRVFRLGVPWLTSVFQREVEHACPICGHVIHWQIWVSHGGPNLPSVSARPLATGDTIEHKRPMVSDRSAGSGQFTSVSYTVVFRSGENVLFPVFEGNIQDTTMIDRHGDPDLMADFAEEYLKQFRILMPTGRIPSTLREIMPALLILVTATELAVKAYWIRSWKEPNLSHSLIDLYQELPHYQRDEVERRFAMGGSNSWLQALGVEGPKIEAVLRIYSDTYGGGSNVHKDSRYYAEPTTMLRASSDLRGANLVKGNTPYPIFLPDAVRALIDTYRFYSGPKRLRRLGADLLENGREPGNDNHGEWGLIPSSLGLVVIAVSQEAGTDARDEDLRIFNDFMASYPTDLWTNWMYGGNTLLFYRDVGVGFHDGRRIIDGLKCRVWSQDRLGLHPRDLNLLAVALEGFWQDGDEIGLLGNPGVESD